MELKWNILGKNCFAECEVNNWLELIQNIESVFMNKPKFLYRGQQDSDWKLELTFDRYYRQTLENLGKDFQPKYNYEYYLNNHLENFKKNSVGRRINPNNKLENNEW